jgi:hypothetical protein
MNFSRYNSKKSGEGLIGVKGIYLLLLYLCLSGCNVYNTLRIEALTEEDLRSLQQEQGTVVIHNNREQTEYLLTDFALEGNTIKGIVRFAPKGKKHPHHQKQFSASKVNAYKPLSVLHLYIRNNEISPGPMWLPISQVRFVEIHEPNKGKSIGRTVGVIGSVITVFFVGVVLL